MSILSITFHTIADRVEQWDSYVDNELQLLIDNLIDVERFVLSDVYTDMLNEGKNTNLILWFDNQNGRQEFLESELPNLEERIFNQFGNDVMIFPTFLNPKKQKL